MSDYDELYRAALTMSEDEFASHLYRTFEEMYYGAFSYFRKPLIYRYMNRSWHVRLEEQRVLEELGRLKWLDEVERKLARGLEAAARGQKIDWDAPLGRASYKAVD